MADPSNPISNPHEATQKQTILVIGDWFIDENWLMARCNNYHSTNVGDFHYTSLLHGPDCLILSVCGVANVLKILFGNPEDRKGSALRDKYNLIGIGAWNQRDTGILLIPSQYSGLNAINMI
jgi:hypothetical protein